MGIAGIWKFATGQERRLIPFFSRAGSPVNLNAKHTGPTFILKWDFDGAKDYFEAHTEAWIFTCLYAKNSYLTYEAMANI